MSIGQIGIAIVIAAGVAWAFRHIARRSRYAVADADQCAACGYDVRGLPSAVCPECGADLSRPGAVRPRGWRLPMSQDARIFAWCAAFWLGFWGVNAAWLNRVPEVRQTESEVRASRPHSDAFRSLELTYAGEIYLQQPLAGRGRIEFVGLAGAKSDLMFDGVGDAIRAAGAPGGGGGGELGPNVVLDRLRDAGVADVSAADVVLDAQDVVALIRKAAREGSGRAGQRFRAETQGLSGRSRAIYPITAARWALVLVWLAGCVALWQADRPARG